MPILEITTIIGCPLRCTLCPQDKLSKNFPKSSPRLMSIENYKKIIDKIPNNVVINFCGMSEPFSNPNCLDFIKYSAGRENPIYIHSTLQGASREATDFIKELKLSGKIQKLIVHLPDGHKNMPGFKDNDDYFYALETIAPCDGVKLMTMSSSGIIEESVYNYLHLINNNKINKKLPKGWRGLTRAGNLNIKKVDKDTLAPNYCWDSVVSCSYSHYYDHNVLLPNGDVVLCCMDYSQKHVIGNLLESNYEDLFKTKEFLNIIKLNMKPGFSEESLCKSCELAICHEMGISGELKTSWPERNGRRTTELARQLYKYKVPSFIVDFSVDLNRFFKRMGKGQKL